MLCDADGMGARDSVLRDRFCAPPAQQNYERGRKVWSDAGALSWHRRLQRHWHAGFKKCISGDAVSVSCHAVAGTQHVRENLCNSATQVAEATARQSSLVEAQLTSGNKVQV